RWRMKIRWNTDVNAPGCPGEICAVGRFRKDERPEPILIQTDWEYPGVARSFGWDIATVQRCSECGEIGGVMPDGNAYCCDAWTEECDHDGTDGTVDCLDCGVTNSEFITAADEWLRSHD